jgi:signal transduction histidine kinase
MFNFRDLPIKRKLTLIIAATAGMALVLASTAFVAYEIFMFRQTMVRNLSTLAEIIGANSTAALIFNDPRAAEETLAALKAEGQIISAYIYGREGAVFARYIRKHGAHGFSRPPALDNGYRFASDHLALSRRILLDNDRVGTILIQSDLQALYSRLTLYGGIVISVILISSVVAISLSAKLQRVVSEPILHLAQVAGIVSAKKNYTVRATKHGNDELGLLIDGFNEMLQQIQQRDAALQNAHDELERRVEERTKELQEEIIERKRAEAKIQTLNEELEQRVMRRTAQLQASNKELEAFSYSVSHDLRGPLRSIDGFSKALLIENADQLNERGKHYLERVRAASQRMEQLIDDLLNLSRITRGEMRMVPVNLSELAQTVVDELKRPSSERAVDFLIAPALSTEGDPRLLRVLLENLFNNAWKFTSKHPRATIELGAAEIEGESTFFVRDDGAGFDMAYADKLFAPFQRVHSQDEFEGTGIGLATVQRIIHRHGGHVWAEGAVEQGATFYFRLSQKGEQNERQSHPAGRR